MTPEELGRLKKGESLNAEIHKLYKQVESLQKCDKVKIFTTDIDGKRIDFDIVNGNPMYPLAENFMSNIKDYWFAVIREKEKQFSDL